MYTFCLHVYLIQGEDGVYNILNIVKEEFRQTMALSGCPKLSDITKDMVIKIIDIDSN